MMKRTYLPDTFLSYLPQFKTWWINKGHGEASARSYISYIRKAVNIFNRFKPVVDNGLDQLLFTHKIVKRTARSENKITRNIKILMVISLKESTYSLGTKKTYSNALSGISQYFDFLSENGYGFEDHNDTVLRKSIKQALVASKSNKVVFKYRNSEICSNFTSRLNTQDRVYQHVCYILANLSAVMKLDRGLDKKYAKLKKDKRNESKFIVSPDGTQTISLSAVKLLEIRPCQKCEIIDYSGHKYQVYTEAFPFDQTVYEPMLAMDIDQLSIDHDTPLMNLLEDHYQDYPFFVELSKKIAAYFQFTGSDYKVITGKIKDQKAHDAKQIIITQNIDVSFAFALYKEIETLLNSTGYSIMYGPYNSQKSA